MKKIILIALGLLLAGRINAATITAVNNGPWGTNSTWNCNCQPGNGDNVIIPAGKTVSITAGPVILSGGPVITITIAGTLSLNTGGTLLIDNSDIIKIPTGGKISASGILDAVWFGGSPYFVPGGTSINGPATMTNGTLPVTLLVFEGTVEGESASLTWSTASEEGFDYFDIERSNDGMHFKSITHVAGAGNSKIRHDYQYTDNGALDGVSYYRLSAVDFDGRTESFEIVRMELHKADQNLAVSIFPNPLVGRQVTASLNFGPGVGLISIYDSQGGLVLAEPLSTSLEYVLNLPSGIAAGIYYVIVRTGQGQYQSRLAVH